MGCDILGNENEACFYCNTTMTPFAPIMSSVEEAEEFETWLNIDPREFDREDLEKRYYQFLKEEDSQSTPKEKSK